MSEVAAREAVEDRFWSKVLIPGEVLSGCWEWTAARTRLGYGVFEAGGRQRTVRAHRMALEIFRGPVPAGLVVMHSCDNPGCVNPSHLRAGTHADNIADRHAKGRTAAGVNTRQAKITDSVVRDIRRRADAGEPTHTLAARFGLHGSTVRRIKSRSTWAHVSQENQ